MAQNTTIKLESSVWTLLTDANVTALRVKMQSGDRLLLKATVGATAPTTSAGAIALDPLQILPADVVITSIWPGVIGANRVYGYIATGGTVSVSHA